MIWFVDYLLVTLAFVWISRDVDEKLAVLTAPLWPLIYLRFLWIEYRFWHLRCDVMRRARAMGLNVEYVNHIIMVEGNPWVQE